jgi:peptide chain release factor 2
VKLCGAIFDAPAKEQELTRLEAEINDPDFWNQPEKSQRVMQQRKRLEEAIQNSGMVALSSSDIETLFELAREGENVNGDLEREIRSFEARTGPKCCCACICAGQNGMASRL